MLLLDIRFRQLVDILDGHLLILFAIGYTLAIDKGEARFWRLALVRVQGRRGGRVEGLFLGDTSLELPDSVEVDRLLCFLERRDRRLYKAVSIAVR